MERKDPQNPQDPKEQPRTDMDKEREARKKPMQDENARDDNSVGKVPDPQGEDKDQKRGS